MSKWVVDIHGEIEGDYELIKKYEEPKTDVLDKIRAEIIQVANQEKVHDEKWALGLRCAVNIIDKYRENEEIE